MSTFDKLAVGGAVLLVGISLLSPGGFVVGLTLGILLLVATFGGKYLLQLEQSRRFGEKAGPSMRDRLGGNDGDGEGGWSR